MSGYIFRNYTVEYLFTNMDVNFSGYDEVFSINDKYEYYVFMYFCNIDVDYNNVSKQIQGYIDKIKYLISNIPNNKNLYIFTLKNIYDFNLVCSNRKLTQKINNFNKWIYQLQKNYNNVKIIDIDDFLTKIKTTEVINWKYFYMYQMVINPVYVSQFQEWYKEQINRMENKKIKKCLVVDLDNTIWGGVIGEDDPSKIALGGSFPGNIFLDIQKLILELKKVGVILCISSKNNYEDVKKFFESNPNMALKLSDFIVKKINWNEKYINITEISKELNIGLDSIVFLDDSPIEREKIKQMLPEVYVVDFPESKYEYLNYFYKEFKKLFSKYELTNEDKNKTKQYKQRAKQEEYKSKFNNYNEFIKNLKINIEYGYMDDYNVGRIEQLFQKTNQFNLTTYRYKVSDLKTFKEEKNLVMYISVKNKFGDSGIVGASVVKFNNDSAQIDSLLLSCRALGVGIENIFLKIICNDCYDRGFKKIYGDYIKTSKNVQVANFYTNNGFKEVEKQENKAKYFIKLNQKFKLDEEYGVSIIGR